MHELPPLNALKAFESAARNLSFVGAALELHVTATAVSQQVRKLEAFYRRKLFTRLNNRIVLTDAGQAILAAITPALEDISAVTSQMVSGTNRASLVVSVIPSLAECWFMPRLGSFPLVAEGFRIDLRVEPDPVDLSTGKTDLRICYGGSAYQGLDMVPLFRDQVLPLCAPDLAKGLNLASVDQSLLIHTVWGQEYGSHPTWDEWFRCYLPARRVTAQHGFCTGSSQLAIDFARRGLGIALGQRGLAQELIEADRLVVLQNQALPLGQDYCIVIPTGKRRKNGVQALISHLKAGCVLN